MKYRIAPIRATAHKLATDKQPSDLHLALLGGAWKIAGSPDPLPLPLTSAYYFCQDLIARGYDAAYNQMPSSARSKFGSATSLKVLIGLSQTLAGKPMGCQLT
jgi:hypothetical protein